jgi:beta-phosphoglucomutase
MIKNIIFDLDGVLFDGCELHATLFLNALNYVYPDLLITKEYHSRVLNGLSTKKKLEILQISEEGAKKVYEIKQEMTFEYIEKNIQPSPKNIEICKTLLSKGYQLFCVTNSIRKTVEMILEGSGISHFFTGVISNQDTTEPKPSPQPYLSLYKKYGLNPKECLILEDSIHGIESARKSGGNLLCVSDCTEVTLQNILNAIDNLD